MTVKYKYVWKELTQDGLLKEPRKCGNYYDEESVNGYDGGWSSVGEAEAQLIAFKEKHEWSFSTRGLMLIKLVCL